MNLGIFCGSFNPPHLGHLIVSESVRDQLSLEKTLLIPSANPPNKQIGSLLPVSDRLAMTRLAAAGNPALEVSDMESARGGMSYTVDTVEKLSVLYAGWKLHLIIGADNLLEFDTWRSPDRILAHATLVAMTRPGYEVDAKKSRFHREAVWVKVPQIGISGTEIRRRIRMGRSIRYMVPLAVEEYIMHRGLYKL
jgi:nicotinate-nucleotide adenylyltransferase